MPAINSTAPALMQARTLTTAMMGGWVRCETQRAARSMRTARRWL